MKVGRLIDNYYYYNYFVLKILIIAFKSRKTDKNIQKSRPRTGFFKPGKNHRKNAPNEKSRDFCLTFMNSMEDGRRNPGSRPWTFQTQENPRLLTNVNTNSELN
jgi:hypothetical protein